MWRQERGQGNKVGSAKAVKAGPRVVVGLRPPSWSRPPLEAAAALAAAIKAELVGLFIEEEAAFDLAGLPFARAFNIGAKRPLSLDPSNMTKAYADCASLMRRELTQCASQAKVRWSFASHRGDMQATFRARASRSDFIVLSDEPSGFGMHEVLQELRNLSNDAEAIMIVNRRARSYPGGSVIVIDDGDSAGEKTVALGCRIAAAIHADLKLFAIAGTSTEKETIEGRARKIGSPETSFVSVQRFLPGAVGLLAAALMQETPSFIVADLEGDPFRDDKAVRLLFRSARAPIVLTSRSQEQADRRPVS